MSYENKNKQKSSIYKHKLMVKLKKPKHILNVLEIKF